MKIVQVAHGYPPRGVGGTELYVQSITRGLKGRGHDLYVYAGCIEWRETFQSEVERIDGVEVTRVHRDDFYFDRWDKAYNPLVEEHFRDYLARRRPDLIHVHQWIRLTSNLCAIAARAGIPSVVSLHDLYTTCPRLFRMRRDGALCRAPCSQDACVDCVERWRFQNDDEIRYALASFKADQIAELAFASHRLAPSKSHADRIASSAGIEPQRIETLPLGCVTKLEPAPRPAKGEKLQIVFFSHLYPYKGPRVLIDAFLSMRHREKASLHLFGGEVLPDFANELKSMVAGMDVTFHGPYRPEDLESFPMDVVVLPTLVPESYSLILDEAASLRVPVLASDIGAISERANASMRLFEPGDARALARLLDEPASDRGRLDAMREAPSLPVMSLSDHVDRLEVIYGQAISKGPSRIDKDSVLPGLKDQWIRREFGLKELIRSEKWEPLVDSLKARIAELEAEILRGGG